jgi:thiol-disulfide isomerase/thioredoxin
MRLLILSGWLLMATWLGAAPVKLDSLKVGSVTFTNVTVVGANATDLFFTHNNGISNVKLRLLSPALQKQFHYDATEAELAEREQADADSQYQTYFLTNAVETNRRLKEKVAAQTEAIINSKIADPISEQSLLDKPAPPLALDKWVDDEKPALDGKFVLVSFWAPWSVPCLKQIPTLNAFQKAFTNQLTVVGVCAESVNDIQEIGGDKIVFPCAIDPQSKLSAAVGVTSIPSVMLIGPDHLVRYIGHPAALTEANLKSILDKGVE